ncbi:uncharacterized protein LOC110021967 [Phalaenopsis equestris]|uniref:uncharacterized protein LOC110021967 n=1 Tax=Phalaenopsis equestris TaxID=78828 RepID=UPI0009E400A6|nr:uncharacterized protein LOC110021967 [Phalaenopsis equestris]
MIRLEGIGRSGDRGHHPPPPGLCPSSSTLSPLAPPFTVDRWVPAVANPNFLPPPPAAAPDPPTGAMSPYFVPTGGSRLRSLNSGLATAEATPCYPYYDPARDSVDDTLEKTSNYKGYVGGWSGTFDLEEGRPARGSVVNSSWMDCMASCQMSSALQKRGTADNFSAYEKSFGSWLGAHNESSFTHGHVGSECSEWLDDRHREIYMDKSRVSNGSCFSAELDTTLWPNDGSSYFYSPDTTSVVKECDAFIRSPYERYVRQLISCSGEPEGHYPAQTTSRQAYAPSNEKNESVLSCVLKHGNSVIKHAKLHGKNDDYVDYAIGMQNEASIHENAEGNEGFVKMGISSDATQKNGGTPDYSLQIKNLLSGNSSAIEQSIDSLQAVKFGFKVGNLSCCNATNSERGIFIPDDSTRATEEIPDHLNVAVDSPCWKGASMSRWYPFSPNEILQPLVNTLTGDNDELVQGPRSLNILSDIDGTFACNGNGKDIDLPPVTDLSGSDLKFHDCVERESNPAKVESGMEIKQHDIHGEHNNVLNEQVSVPQGIDDHVRQVSQVESNVWNAGSNTSETIPAVRNSDFVFNHISTSPNSSAGSDPNASNGEMNLSSLNAVFPAKPKNPVPSAEPKNPSYC